MSTAGMPTTRLTPLHQQWEYHLLTLDVRGVFGAHVDLQSLQTRLNALGAEGWELDSTTPVNAGEGFTQEILFVLKRPVI